VLCYTQVMNAEGEGGLGMSARPRRRSGNLSALKVELWAAIRAASAIVGDRDSEPELKLKAASTLATAGGVYLRILEGSDTEDRVAQMETLMRTVMEQAQNGYGTR
jgi:hypothetical protein